MQIILPEKKSRGRRYAVLGVAAAFALGLAVASVVMKPPVFDVPPPSAAKPADDAEDRRLRAEIERLEGEVDRYFDAMWLAEELGDRKRYMDLVAGAAQKNLEADTAWFAWQESKRRRGVLAEGVKQAVMEAPPLPGFTNDDKFAMLAEEHGLSVDALKALKAEMEVLFADELIEKFGPPHEHAAAPAAEDN